MIRPLLLAFLWILSFPLFSQSNLALGEWELLLPYDNVISLTSADDKIYYATPYSVFSRDESDGSVEHLDLVSGLSETDIRFIKYDRNSKNLFIIYQNSNIDVIVDDQIINLPIIKDKQITGDKFIYDITFKDNIAYLSCGFGLVGLNISTSDAAFTTFTEKPVSGVGIINGVLYASITDGIYHINLDEVNIQDFLVWEKLESVPAFPSSFSAGILNVQNETLYFDMNNVLMSYQISNKKLDTIFTEVNHRITKMTHEGEGLIATLYCDGPGQWDACNGKVIYIPSGDLPSDTIRIIGSPAVRRPIDAIQQGHHIRLAEEWYPFRDISLNGGYFDHSELNGPYSGRTFRTAVFDDTLYVLAGRWSPTKSYPNHPIADGMYYQDLNNKNWNFVNRSNYSILRDSAADYNYMDIAVHPVTRKKYIGTFGGGLIEVDGEDVKIFNSTNSILQPALGLGDHSSSVLGLAYDRDNNLWAANYASNRPLVVFKEDGSQLDFNIGATNQFTNRLLVDDFDNKWIIIVSKGLMVFSTGESLNDQSDDKYKVFNTSNSELQTNTINDIAMDHDGFIWAGTNEGVVVFDCGGDVFGEYCRGNRRIASLDGFNAYLLEDEKVNAVMIDGGNRKWFGTGNGVFVLSPTGEEVIYSFNINNSPLPSNDIQSLSINKKTGTVFIGTSFGLISYQGEATEGGPLHKEEIYAYPNPVRPDYTGPIAITGLAQNANVKITDVEGRLVYELEAIGGQAIWDGKDYNHRKVESGVYLVFSTSQPGLSVDTAVAKIVIIK